VSEKGATLFLPLTLPVFGILSLTDLALNLYQSGNKTSGIFNYCFDRNLLLSLSVKEFWKWVSIPPLRNRNMWQVTCSPRHPRCRSAMWTCVCGHVRD